MWPTAGTNFWGVDRDQLGASTLSLLARAKQSLAVVETLSKSLLLHPIASSPHTTVCSSEHTKGYSPIVP